MGNISVILFDSDEVYMRRLAAALKNYLKDSISVFVFSKESQLLAGRDTLKGAVIFCGIRTEINLRDIFSDSIICWLQGEENAEDEHEWDRIIFKYQSVRKIAGEICRITGTGRGHRRKPANVQNWYGVVSPCHHGNTGAFAAAAAQILSERSRVLLIAAAEFTGLRELLELPEMSGLEQLILHLRSEDSVEEMSEECFSVRVGNFSVLCFPDNPLVLCELTSEDLIHMENYIKEALEADTVIWYMDSLFGYGLHILSRCTKVFCLEKNDICSRCIQREFENYLSRACAEPADLSADCLEKIILPETAWQEKGEHLLLQWKNSVFGEEIRKRIGDTDEE